ncbi:MAG: hypothetical protein A2Y76_00320 [Planctomycetes bacterium RBG_13_60_9]|nr:MAG: hypothetical protein A2Y76_00320 [Planctomycetes bacterium RBG_13_60_9]
MAFLRFSHHGDTEDTENGIKTMFISEFAIISVISVSLWWFFGIPAVCEDSAPCCVGFGGGDGEAEAERRDDGLERQPLGGVAPLPLPRSG